MTEFLPSNVTNSLSQLDLVLRTPHSIPEIPDLLNQTVLLGGKRLRPALCFMAGQLFGLSTNAMAPFARAAEFTHSASLAHDDVLDNARLRRNHPTLFAKTSTARAVLAGDLLLARVMVELSQMGNVQIINDLALVVEDLVNGEWLQLQARGEVNISYEHLLEVSRRKTASLMSWSCRVAARLSHPEEEKLLSACTDFGLNLGVAFQMIDDVIDFESSSQKDFAKDYKEGLVNYVLFELIKQNPELKKEISDNLGKGDDAKTVWTSSQLEQAQDLVRLKAQKFIENAQNNLSVMNEYLVNTPEAHSSMESLRQLLLFLGVRAV